jgi:hypothetical protein
MLCEEMSMRLWSLHPKYLDAKGLVALWRETLLAQAVLRGETRGYTNHPQLQRFRAQNQPLSAIAEYLTAVHAEALSRGYAFNHSKIGQILSPTPMQVTLGQMEYERQHLLAKLAVRSPPLYQQYHLIATLEAHPMFQVRAGEVERWERQIAL